MPRGTCHRGRRHGAGVIRVYVVTIGAAVLFLLLRAAVCFGSLRRFVKGTKGLYAYRFSCPSFRPRFRVYRGLGV